MTQLTITAFRDSPDGGRGLARDMRVRWALEEAGQPYDVELLTFEEMKRPDYLAIQPFGQIPAYREGELALFETGAILLHIAEKHPDLLPSDAVARERAITWLFAALNTVEPPIVEREQADFEQKRDWFDERLDLLEDRIRDRFKRLSAWLEDADWLEGEFTIGDLMMVMVLYRAEEFSIPEEFPNLARYLQRGKARPAFQRAYAAQAAVAEASKKENTDA